MFGCLFTGTLLLSCIDPNLSDLLDFLERVVRRVGPVEKDVEVDTEGSFSLSALGPSGGGDTCSGVELLVLPGPNWRRKSWASFGSLRMAPLREL